MDTPERIEVFTGEALRAACFWPGRARLIVRFDHWRRDRDGFPMDVPRGKFAASGCACLTIESARNDWFLNRDLPALRLALEAFAKGYDRAGAIGFSMGGYGALLLARELRLAEVVLVSPQFSILPEKAPYEMRYRREAETVLAELDEVGSDRGATLRGAVVYDPGVAPDVQHTKRICAAYPGLVPVPMWFGGHPALGVVAKHGRYGKVLEALFSGEVRAAELLSLHKQARRKSETYHAGIRQYLARRAARE